MRFKLYYLLFILVIGCNTNNNRDWIYLFDGKSTDGWRAYNGETIPEKWACLLYTSPSPRD